MNIGHGGKRNNAGRKRIADTDKKQTTVIRVDVNLLPAIEKLKQGLIFVTENQEDKEEIERWKQRNIELVIERDRAIHNLNQLTAEINRLNQLKAENNALKTRLDKQKTYTCQCLTAKGIRCDKPALHENIVNGFIVFTCQRHYKTKISPDD
jgi:chromosome segregation ATPase